ncbi:MAG: phenylacetate--CoA ligase family protein [Solirubrobacteraceae bacterium]
MSNDFQRGRLGDARVRTIEDLRALPFMCKDALLEDQALTPPFGTNITYPVERYTHLHLTSGTVGEQLRVPQTAEDWAATRACFARVLREAGIGARDRVALPFAFGPYLQFWAAAAGVEEIGALMLPLGGVDGRERLRMIAEFGATAIICTPSYALTLIEVAGREGLQSAFDEVRTIVCQGEPGGSIGAARERIEAVWRARVLDHAGSTEVGVFTYPCAGGGLHVNEDAFICEVLDPHTGRYAGEGQQGELVLSSLRRSGYPVIRYRGGDVVDVGGPCPGGHTDVWLPNGIVGRTDDMVVIRGRNVFPSTIEATLREVGVLGGYRIRFYTEPAERDEVRVLVETTDPTLVAMTEEAIFHRLALRVRVVPVMPGTLAQSGQKARRVEDLRHRRGATNASHD